MAVKRCREASVPLDCDHAFRATRQDAGEDPEARADLEDRLVTRDRSSVDLASGDPLIDKEVLPEAAARTDS